MKPDLPFVALAAGKHATNWQLAPNGTVVLDLYVWARKLVYVET